MVGYSDHTSDEKGAEVAAVHHLADRFRRTVPACCKCLRCKRAFMCFHDVPLLEQRKKSYAPQIGWFYRAVQMSYRIGVGLFRALAGFSLLDLKRFSAPRLARGSRLAPHALDGLADV